MLLPHAFYGSKSLTKYYEELIGQNGFAWNAAQTTTIEKNAHTQKHTPQQGE